MNTYYHRKIAQRAQVYAEGDKGAGLHYSTGALWMLGNMWQEFTPRNCPPLETEVLVLGATGDVAIHQIILDPKDKRIQVWFPEVKCRITHWMPIPKKPTME